MDHYKQYNIFFFDENNIKIFWISINKFPRSIKIYLIYSKIFLNNTKNNTHPFYNLSLKINDKQYNYHS